MSLYNEVCQFVDIIGYNLETKESLKLGLENAQFNQLVFWLSNELIKFHEMDDVAVLHPINDAFDQQAFLMELSGFLREYGCPHSMLLEGSLVERFATEERRLLLLHYLFSELMATRMLAKRKTLKSQPTNKESSALSHEIFKRQHRFQSSRPNALIAKRLRLAGEAVHCEFAKSGKIEIPGALIAFFNEVKAIVDKLPDGHLGNPLLKPKRPLTDKQWMNLEKIADVVQRDYKHRKETLLKRLDVTLQSFKWSPKAKANIDAICKVILKSESVLRQTDDLFSVAHVLSARDNPLLILHRTSSGQAREGTACKLNKLLMGSVPDRGGRAWELDPPPQEDFSSQQSQRQDSHRGGGRGGSARGHDGGRGGQRGRGDYHRNEGTHFGGGGGGFDRQPSGRDGYAGGSQQYEQRDSRGRGRGRGGNSHRGDGGFYGRNDYYGAESAHPANAFGGAVFHSSKQNRHY